LLCAVPQLALAGLDASDATRADLQRELARGLFAVGAGQQRDLMLSAGACPDLDEVEAAVAGKTGDRRALFARLAARLAGAGPREAEGLAAMARHFGIALQWASDLADAVAAEGGRDLAAGTPTLPVVLWLRAQPDAAVAWARVRAARRDTVARAGLRAALGSGGVLRGCQLKIEGERARARAALAGLSSRGPFHRRLDLWLGGGW
jgi:geranylgeranyl pyrophosphate synthase